MASEETQIALLRKDNEVMLSMIRDLRTEVKELRSDIEKKYVTWEQFSLPQKLIFGVVSVILLGFLNYLTSLVYQKSI